MKYIHHLLIFLSIGLVVSSCKDDDDKTPETPPISYAPCNSVLDGWDIHVNPLPINKSQGQNDLCFVDENIGYTVGGEGTILKTMNGGKDWVILEQAKDPATNQPIPDAVTRADLYSVFFVNEQVGFVGGYYDFLPNTNETSFGSVLLKTTDGGENWSIQYFTDVIIIKDLHFFDANNGLGLFSKWGNNPSIADDFLFKTQDGGATWEPAASPVDKPIWGRQFDIYSDGVGVLVGDDSVYKKYQRSTDKGNTWTEASIYDGFCHLMDYRTAEEGYCHCFGQIYYTTDTGVTWNNIKSDHLYDAPFVNHQSPSEAFAFWPVTEEVIVNGKTDQVLTQVDVYQTKDGGRIWKKSAVAKDCPMFGKEYIYSEDLFYTLNLLNVTKFKKK